MSPRRWYAFQFHDGTGTTTGGEHGRRLHIAGSLISFSTRQERDAFVAAGYSTPVPRNWGRFRLAVTRRSLPMGWRVEDAQPHEDFDGVLW